MLITKQIILARWQGLTGKNLVGKIKFSLQEDLELHKRCFKRNFSISSLRVPITGAALTVKVSILNLKTPIVLLHDNNVAWHVFASLLFPIEINIAKPC